MGQTLDNVKAAGVKTIIDLRTADHNDKLCRRCVDVGLGYLHVPRDAKTMESEELAVTLPTLFDAIDGNGFYISCQQGLHRTDIALALYFFYHNDREVPQMVGHRTKGFLRFDDIMRRINTMRPVFFEMDNVLFEERRKSFLTFNRNFQ